MTVDDRSAARALLIRGGCILLVEFGLPDGSLWAVPGGGVERDESFEEAVRRELREEIGATPKQLSGPVWERTVSTIATDSQFERYFLASEWETSTFNPEFSADQLRTEGIMSSKWWQISDILNSGAAFAPSRLGYLLLDLLRHGPPTQPILTGP